MLLARPEQQGSQGRATLLARAAAFQPGECDSFWPPHGPDHGLATARCPRPSPEGTPTRTTQPSGKRCRLVLEESPLTMRPVLGGLGLQSAQRTAPAAYWAAWADALPRAASHASSRARLGSPVPGGSGGGSGPKRRGSARGGRSRDAVA